MPVTIGQLSDQLALIKNDIAHMSTQIDKMADQALDRRVSTLEETVQWISRLVIGGVVTATIGGIVGLVFAVIR